ncbi:MAG TPA: hypothetical protein VHF25_04405 [Nitriliruptorales bacterium]|nr:hypothetical protein [Nitriliruptorales bacterium]
MGSDGLRRRQQSGGLAVTGLLAVGVCVATLDRAVATLPYDTSGALLVAPALIAVTVPWLLRIAHRDGDAWLGRVLVAAFLLKLVASVVRYYVAFEVYEGVADAVAYDVRAAELAPVLRGGSFDLDLGFPIPGTGFPVLLTTMVYALIGPTRLGAFLMFAWLAFIGAVLFVRAFRLALPDGDRRRYTLAVLLLPSLLFWPASIGKESWLMLVLGVATYGTARIFARRRGGYLIVALGLCGLALVRPHVSVLVAVALTVGYLRRRAARTSRPGLAAQVVGLTLLLLGGMVLVRQTQRFFGVEELSVAAATDVFEDTRDRTAAGGSEFEASPVRSPLDLPAGLVTVLFRPFPHEAHNAQALLASLEGLVLLALFATSARRLRGLPRLAWRDPYVAFAVSFVLMFAVAFSNFGNFGLLVRQRVQVLPLALILMALPLRASATLRTAAP